MKMAEKLIVTDAAQPRPSARIALPAGCEEYPLSQCME
jgi:hypothetical protein